MTRILITVMLLIPQETLRVKVSLVTVGVRVTDSRGRNVPGLKAESFSVFDDGVAQKIEFFSSEEQPITMGILFDHSFSMLYNFKIDRAKEAASALVRATREGSEYFYVAFDDQVKLAADFTTDRERIDSAIQKTVLGGGTSLYDAVLQGLALCSRAQWPRQALVIISDGADQHSKHGLQEMMSIVRESEMQIYTIGYFGPEEEKLFRTAGPTIALADGREIDNPRVVLDRLARESGAESFFPKTDAELAKAVEEITNDLRTQYTVTFYPPPSERENRYHQLRVNVRGGRYNVRARPGYGTLEIQPAAERRDTSLAYEAKVEKKNGAVFYHDDFRDPNSGWPNRTNAKYSRDGYLLTGDTVAAMNGPVFRNFRASVSVAVDSAAPSSPAPANNIGLSAGGVTTLAGGGLIFRQNDDGYYALVVFPAQGFQPGMVTAIRVERLKTTELDRWPLIRKAGRAQKIEVRCRETECDIYQDDNRRGRIKDKTFSEGRAGLYLSGRGDALFHDLIVEEIK